MGEEGKNNPIIKIDVDAAKEKLNAGKDKVNERIKGLAFRGMLEKKIPEETRAKFPVLDRIIPLTNYIVCALALLIIVVVVASIAGGSGRNNATSSSQSSARVNFGSYPADYEIAYFNLLGYAKAPTVRALFGPNAVFATTFTGAPATVVLESGTVERNTFTGTLLLSAKSDSGADIRIMRAQFSFEPDRLTEKNYVKHVKIANLMSGEITEKVSYGGELQDGEVFGFFAGFMDYLWDVTKLK